MFDSDGARRETERRGAARKTVMRSGTNNYMIIHTVALLYMVVCACVGAYNNNYALAVLIGIFLNINVFTSLFFYGTYVPIVILIM